MMATRNDSSTTAGATSEFADVPDSTLRRCSLANLGCMGHCAPAVLQTLLEASNTPCPRLVQASGALAGGIGNTGRECGALTAPLILIGLRHARDPLDGGVPVVVAKGRELLRRFTRRHGTTQCRQIRGDDRLPWRCVGVVCHAPELYRDAVNSDAAAGLSDETRRSLSQLHAHFTQHRFHCAHAVVAECDSLAASQIPWHDALAGFVGGTVFTGATCSALTAGMMVIGAELGGIEHSRLRVLRMLARMALGADALADERNAFNPAMNLGQRLSRWFEETFGSTQCRSLTGSDLATPTGADAFIARGRIERCVEIAHLVARRVRQVTADAAAEHRRRNNAA